MKHILFAALSVATLVVRAQTYFYVDHITVVPGTPTPQDNITISLSGGLASTGAYVVSASASVTGNTVTLNVVAADPGGFTVIVPHTEQIPVGPLPAGTYTIVINGTFVGDFAPQPEHTFVVSGGGQLPACDSLDVISVHWAPFDPGTVEVMVSNGSSELFDYPAFVLLDDQGDTLAMEQPVFFGIGGGPQIHALTVHPLAQVPASPFTATLHLWTSFFDSLACELPVNVDLCPPGPCVPVQVHLGNFGGAIVTGLFDWNLLDGGGNTVFSGTLELGALEFDSATVCLPPGSYTLTMVQPQPVGGQLVYGVSAGPLGLSTVSESFVSGGTVNELPFTLYEACINAGQSVGEAPAGDELNVYQEGGRVVVSSAEPLGVVELLDMRGRSCAQVPAGGTRCVLTTDGVAAGVFLVRVVGDGTVRTRRVVVP
ncbi:MAG: hypothetical protein JNJ64_02825 [Flavobacteriales bacterium]|nr:hypothetical protein [Flavobacteriales bacterium]